MRLVNARAVLTVLSNWVFSAVCYISSTTGN